MDIDWKKIVKTVAPTLATALGGPLAGVATTAISHALLGRDDATEDEITAALLNPNSDALMALKKAELDFKAKMKKLDVDIDRIHAQDRDSARQRDIQTRDGANFTLAILVSLGFFGVLAAHIWVEIPESAQTPLSIMLGSLGTGWLSVLTYYFGSSIGSAEKNKILAAGGPPKWSP